MRRGYYASLALLDKEVGRVLAALARRGLAENTLVIFLSDHGDSLGDHGLFVKGVHLYDQAIRVPLIVRWPTRLPAGRRVQRLVQPHDLAATVLSAAGLEKPPDMPDSGDLLPLARGEVDRVHDHAFCLYRNSGINDQKEYWQPSLNSTMIRDERFKLVLYHAVPQVGAPAAVQLFDIPNDPDEQHNLASDPAYADIKAKLLAHLTDWLQCQSSSLESRGGSALPGEDWKQSINNRF
jgi:arylsulfatase A-like enzyme